MRLEDKRSQNDKWGFFVAPLLNIKRERMGSDDSILTRSETFSLKGLVRQALSPLGAEFITLGYGYSSRRLNYHDSYVKFEHSVFSEKNFFWNGINFLSSIDNFKKKIGLRYFSIQSGQDLSFLQSILLPSIRRQWHEHSLQFYNILNCVRGTTLYC